MSWFFVLATCCFIVLQFLKRGQTIECSKETIPLHGAGSESAFGAYQTIGSAYVADRSRIRTIDFNYWRLNSRRGIKQIIDNDKNGTIFAASEITFDSTEKNIYPLITHVPVLAE